MEIVCLLDKEKLSVRDIAKRFNIGKTQAAKILKNKEDIRKKWQSGANIKTKKNFLSSEGLKIDKACFDWFVKARNKNIPLSGPLVKRKAREIAEKLGVSTFRASDGWLQKWRLRNNITFKCISGEAADVNDEDVDQFMKKLPVLLQGYREEDIFNADESGLFFRALPNKTLSLKHEKCKGGKLSKERLTILFCVNSVGEKEDLLVIGKSARPRALRNIAPKDLPATWKSNKKAWMTRDIMTEWLSDLDKKMGLRKRKIILFLDNATSHPHGLKLKNIKIIFLPPNTTSVCQPLDQGIIRNFKFYYRDLIVNHILSKIDFAQSASDLSKSINILESLYYIKSAWQKVTPETIRNCFKKAGFHMDQDNSTDNDYDAEDDLPLARLANLFKCSKELGVESVKVVEEYLNVDEDVETEDLEFSEETEEIEDIESENESEAGGAEEDCNPIRSYKEALDVVSRLKSFMKNDFTGFQHVKNIETHIERCFLSQREASLRQLSILDFIQQKNK